MIGGKDTKNRNLILRLLSPLLAVATSLAIIGVILALSGMNVGLVFGSILSGALSLNLFLKAAPLLLISVGMVVAFKCGLTNLGAEGQLYFGALIAAYLGLSFTSLPGWVLIPVILVLGFIIGAGWAAFPGYLRAKLNLSEVIIGFMMNWIAIDFTIYMILGPLKSVKIPMLPMTDMITDQAWLPTIFGSRIHIGLLFGMVSVFLIYWLVWKTKIGFEIRAVGANPDVAHAMGMKTTRAILLSMVISGGLAGLAGVGEVLGFQHRLMDTISPGYGFVAIAVALAGRNNPVGVMAASIFFGAVLSGADAMRRTIGIGFGLVYLFEGLVILFTILGEIAIRRWFE